MAVARTYEKLTLDGDPFKENGKMYVYVIAPKGKKKVRWYTDAERARMDKAAGIEVKAHDIMDFNARHVFGFGDLGYITVYKGDSTVLEEFVETHHECFRRNLTFGYYTPSRLSVPELPDGITAIRLPWDDVKAHDDRMKPHDEVTRYVAKLIGDGFGADSIFQGTVNTWLERDVAILENKVSSDHFGDKHTHTMVDANGNIYIWETGAKDLAVGTSIHMKMKVKEHKEVNGIQTTVVYYCKII